MRSISVGYVTYEVLAIGTISGNLYDSIIS